MKQYKHIVDQVLEDEGRLIWLFWLSTLVAYPIYSFSYQPMGESFIHKLAFLPVQIIAAYLLLKFQLPKLLYRRRYYRERVWTGNCN